MPKHVPKLVLLALLMVALGAAYLSGLDRYFTLPALQAHRHALELQYAQAPALTVTLFTLLYITLAALAIPGASIMTLGAGAVFGFWPALAIVSVASTAGATLAFWLSRYLLRDLIQHRFAAQLSQINAGLAREGTLYLFALRMIPVFPFFVVNTLMGLTQLRSRSYIWVSQLGMLPGTAAFVYTGLQLGQLRSLSDAFSWPLFSAMVVLGALPLVSRLILRAYRQRKRLEF